jgi:hypothetical protein
MCWTHVICGTHMELFDLTNVTKINHLEITAYDYDVTFDDVTILKYIFKCYLIVLN